MGSKEQDGTCRSRSRAGGRQPRSMQGSVAASHVVLATHFPAFDRSLFSALKLEKVVMFVILFAFSVVYVRRAVREIA